MGNHANDMGEGVFTPSLLNRATYLELFKGEGGGDYHHPLSENYDFSLTEPSLDLRPVCKFEFIQKEKN